MPIAVASSRISQPQIKKLSAEGFEVLPCPPSPLLPDALSHHTDMLLTRLGNTLFCYEGYKEENEEFFSTLSKHRPTLKIECLKEPMQKRYPEDCAYNLLAIGRAVFYNPKSISKTLLRRAEEMGYMLYPTKQGYAACTVLKLGEHHAVTADEGMASALEEAGICVLKIQNGGISLPPYEYGFIGGAGGCFLDRAYFYGDITRHPQFARIEAFAREAGFLPIALSDAPLTDLGGILFIE